MSAFFSSKRTIDNVVTAWFRHPPAGAPDYDKDSLGQALWLLNAESLRQRYHLDARGPSELEEHTENLKEAKAYTYRFQRVSKAQLRKSLESFTYQSCEGTCDQDPLYKQVSEVEAKYVATVSRDSDAYRRASWVCEDR